MLEASPEGYVLDGRLGAERAVDVRDPGAVVQGITHRERLAPSLGDLGVDERRDLGDGATVEPAILTKISSLSFQREIFFPRSTSLLALSPTSKYFTPLGKYSQTLFSTENSITKH